MRTSSSSNDVRPQYPHGPGGGSTRPAGACGAGTGVPHEADTYRDLRSRRHCRQHRAAGGAGLTAGLGQQAIVDNRGSGVIPGEIVARARPDGYTLLSFAGTFWLQPLLRKSVPYDPVRDFAPITTTVSLPTLLVVHPSVAATSVKDLIALARVKPGELNCGSGAVGSPNHLAAALFKSMTGVNMVTINFRGTGPAVLGLLSGQVQLMFSNGVAVMPHVTAGKLRALGVASLKPSPLVPGVPTIAESGVPGYESSIMSGFWAPAGTPHAVVERLNRETVRFLNTAEVRERLFRLGAEPAGSTPAELGAFVKADSLHGSAFADSPLVKRKYAIAGGIAAAYVFAKSSTLVEARE